MRREIRATGVNRCEGYEARQCRSRGVIFSRKKKHSDTLARACMLIYDK